MLLLRNLRSTVLAGIKVFPLRTFYDSRTRSDTIYALATTIRSNKGSPVAIIRISGKKTSFALKSLTQLDPVREQTDNKKLRYSGDGGVIRQLLPRYATLCKITEPQIGALVDVGIIIWFPKPNSFTGEDACELHVHGSTAVVKKLMSILGSLEQVRPAEPGEFTRRAVENGKMTLIQAESMPELIAAQTDQQRRLALEGLCGSTRRRYDAWIEELIRILAHLEASIDFGEDELIGEQRVVNECIGSLMRLVDEISNFVKVTSKCREFTKVGARISILGPPNAGKSTLMNLLCRQEKSIVSDLSGTTRDVVEHSFDLSGHTITLSDTAGLRALADTRQQASSDEASEMPDDMRKHESIEREGMRRALTSARKADLLLYVIDVAEIGLSDDTKLSAFLVDSLKSIAETSEGKVLQLVINKIDLHSSSGECDLGRVEELVCGKVGARKVEITRISCKSEKNIDLLIERVSKSLEEIRAGLDDSPAGDAHLEYANERHLALLGSTLKHLDRASKLDMKNIDKMAQHVRESVDYLSRIVGSVSNDQVFDIIFRDFCIGK